MFRSLLSRWELWSESRQTWSLWHCPFFLLGPSAVASGWGPAELLIHRRGSARIDFCPGLHSYVQSLLNFARGNELLPSSSSLSKFLHSLPSAGRRSSMAWLPDHLVFSSTLCSALCNPSSCRLPLHGRGSVISMPASAKSHQWELTKLPEF